VWPKRSVPACIEIVPIGTSGDIPERRRMPTLVPKRERRVMPLFDTAVKEAGSEPYDEMSKPMKTSSICLAFALALTGAHVFAADLDRSDKEFIKDTYENGLAEVRKATLAESKTGNADVKAFAEHLLADHNKANAELKSLADSKQIEVAKEETMLAKGKIKLLDTKSGADFDKDFVDGMISSHKSSVKSFEKVSGEAKDADVKAFAEKMLPALRNHLSMAEDLQKKIGK
jgi:putative membrane protein